MKKMFHWIGSTVQYNTNPLPFSQVRTLFHAVANLGSYNVLEKSKRTSSNLFDTPLCTPVFVFQLILNIFMCLLIYFVYVYDT